MLISVLDSGRGVSAEALHHLFQPFFTTKEIGVGTGLGLTISNSLADRNGGRLFHEPNSPHTKFCLALPLQGPQITRYSLGAIILVPGPISILEWMPNKILWKSDLQCFDLSYGYKD
ncbi:MAG: ATP-binding protein [Pseudobdellovibrionaceae bacterium]